MNGAHFFNKSQQEWKTIFFKDKVTVRLPWHSEETRSDWQLMTEKLNGKSMSNGQISLAVAFQKLEIRFKFIYSML